MVELEDHLIWSWAEEWARRSWCGFVDFAISAKCGGGAGAARRLELSSKGTSRMARGDEGPMGTKGDDDIGDVSGDGIGGGDGSIR